MTAIGSAIVPTRRPGELGVHSVDRFHFAVPDLKVARNFYGEFGLEIDEDGDLLAMRTRGDRHVWVTIGEGPRKKLGYISFGVFDDDFDRFAERLQALGVKRLDPPPGVDSNGLWLHDHDGNLVEIKVAAKSSPNGKSEFSEVPAGPGERGARSGGTFSASCPGVSRMSFCSRATSRSAIQFYTRVLGLRLSDRSGDGIAFLHGIHGSDHHMIAFAHSNAPGLHHLSWDVSSVDEIGRGAMHMLDKGFAKGGASGATCSAPTSSTMSAIRGGRSANIRPASTMCRPTATGRAAIIRRKICSTCGGRARRTISPTIPRREAGRYRHISHAVPAARVSTVSGAPTLK